MLFVCVTLRGYSPSCVLFCFVLFPRMFWILLISEVFCGLEEIGQGVLVTRCNLIASLDFNNMLGDFCYFK